MKIGLIKFQMTSYKYFDQQYNINTFINIFFIYKFLENYFTQIVKNQLNTQITQNLRF
ncbi:hypothetical protein pb186bvf_004589 [Paramecium bursaria]